MPRLTPPWVVKAIKTYWDDGLVVGQICTKLTLSECTVRRYLHMHGITPDGSRRKDARKYTPPKDGIRACPPEEQERICRLLREGYTRKQVTSITGWSRSTILRYTGGMLLGRGYAKVDREKALDLWRKGMSALDISIECDCDRMTVYNICCGTPRDVEVPKGAPRKYDYEYVRTLRDVKHLPIPTIAKRLGAPDNRVVYSILHRARKEHAARQQEAV